jgi:hypothetical protein
MVSHVLLLPSAFHRIPPDVGEEHVDVFEGRCVIANPAGVLIHVHHQQGLRMR